jgi:hypothetical protein
MSVIAPPDPPPVEEHELDPGSAGDDPEALIEEARQRARRRRLKYAAATAVLALIGVSLMTVVGRPDPSQSASSGSPAPAGPLDQDDAAAIVAKYGAFHVGFVFVYADGRVISMPDLGAYWPPTAGYKPGTGAPRLFERRLTAAGVDLVRSGAVQPAVFLDRPSLLPAGIWADPEFKTYEPSRYAICLGDGGWTDDPTRLIGRLPAAAQTVLRGKERTYLAPRLEFPPDNATPFTCFEVSTEALRETLIGAGATMESAQLPPDPDYVHLFGSVGAWVTPILPHGAPQGFPG